MKKVNISYRLAKQKDCDKIAQIHSENWKYHYRGLVPDHYLDHEVEQDRLNVWRDRFKKNDPNQHIVVAEDHEGKVIGFVCSFLDFHENYGAYLDNLHVLTDYQGLRIGKELMKRAGGYVEEHRPGSPIYLHVLKDNLAAINFYKRINGKQIRQYDVDLPWGGRGPVIDFLWEARELAEM